MFASKQGAVLQDNFGIDDDRDDVIRLICMVRTIDAAKRLKRTPRRYRDMPGHRRCQSDQPKSGPRRSTQRPTTKITDRASWWTGRHTARVTVPAAEFPADQSLDAFIRKDRDIPVLNYFTLRINNGFWQWAKGPGVVMLCKSLLPCMAGREAATT